MSHKPILHVEVQLRPACLRPTGIREDIIRWLRENFNFLKVDQEINVFNIGEHGAAIDSIHVLECSPHDVNSSYHALDQVILDVHTYVMHGHAETNVEPDPSTSLEESSNAQVASTTVFRMPNFALDDLWQSLEFESCLREGLLHQLTRMMTLVRKGDLDMSIHNWNRLVLLHGPPGSGKSSLCQALAQRLAIRSSDIYLRAFLVEINANALHSKWFGESGKEIAKAFSHIYTLAHDSEALVCVLIDEVETIAGSREKSVANGEVGDALRATNQLLTALDDLRRFTNVLILSTSNLIGTVDSAFLSRVDVAKYIANPPTAAAYGILRSCLNDLIRCDLITPPVTETEKQNEGTQITTMTSEGNQPDRSCEARLKGHLAPYRTAFLREPIDPTSPESLLLKIARDCVGFSGRLLRRLPLLALATYTYCEPVRLEDGLDALARAVADEKLDSNGHSAEHRPDGTSS